MNHRWMVSYFIILFDKMLYLKKNCFQSIVTSHQVLYMYLKKWFLMICLAQQIKMVMGSFQKASIGRLKSLLNSYRVLTMMFQYQWWWMLDMFFFYCRVCQKKLPNTFTKMMRWSMFTASFHGHLIIVRVYWGSGAQNTSEDYAEVPSMHVR